MLYEVITPGLLWAESMIFVTGGMSPPYVYEENKAVLGMDLDVVAEFCKKNGITPESKARITSYNVCYTKLLRAPAQGIPDFPC